MPARAETLFALMKPSLDSAAKRYNASVANGKKGGAPSGNSNAKKQPKNNQSFQPGIDPTIDIAKDIAIDIDTALNEPGRTRAFFPPDVQDVNAYCREQGYGSFGERFVDYYESVGWTIGDKPMQDWRAAVRFWNRKEQEKAASTRGGFVLAPLEDPFEVAIREGKYV